MNEEKKEMKLVCRMSFTLATSPGADAFRFCVRKAVLPPWKCALLNRLQSQSQKQPRGPAFPSASMDPFFHRAGHQPNLVSKGDQSQSVFLKVWGQRNVLWQRAAPYY